MDLRTVTLAELLEAAGWTRLNVCQDAYADLWTDPADPKGNRWFGRAAVLEELRRREPAARPPIPSTAPVAEPPPSQSTREPVDGDLLF